MKYIVVTGGVISGIGKGITSSSIGLLLQHGGYNVTMIKIDPYLNIDAGTMSPYEHGECFVLGDGGECDLDLGNYERFLNIDLSSDNNITTGKIYRKVLKKERNGEYLGQTVQMIPHITNEIKNHILETSNKIINDKIPDICIIEVGGTVDDIEVFPFLEALQQMRLKYDFCFVHVSLSIFNQEQKTKPIQRSIASLRSRGISPDVLVVRSENQLEPKIIEKIQNMCHISEKVIFSNPNVKNTYYVPKIFYEQKIIDIITEILHITSKLSSNPYQKIIDYYEKIESLKKIHIGIVGKYVNSPDTYLSIIKSIEHASQYLGVNAVIKWIDSDDNIELSCDCYIIPGGFGTRGILGKLKIAKHCRENNIPLLGICLGLQIMVVECWNSCQENSYGWSSEWEPKSFNKNDTETPISYLIDILPNQTGLLGGTMRLGDYKTCLTPSKTLTLYGKSTVTERHRHRYEINNKYIQELEKLDLIVSGYSTGPSGNYLVEIMENKHNKFYIGCQFHPEYKSRCFKPHPLFLGLISACI